MEKTQARNAIFGRKLEKRKLFSSPHIPDFAADVVTLSGGTRRKLLKAAEGKDTIEQQLLLVIGAFRVVGSDEPLFTVADLDSLLEQPGYVLDELATAALQANGMAVSAFEEAEGNSATTPSSSDGTNSPNGSGE